MRLAVPIAGAALISGFASEARAVATMSSCRVVLQPESADPVWQQAVQDLRARLSASESRDADCGAIEVRADGPRTRVLFTTRDGRSAERPVPAPGGLLALVEALTITIPESDVVRPPAAEQVPEIARDAVTSPASRQPAGETSKAHFLIGGSSGVRLSAPTQCKQSSPGTCAFGALSLGIGVGVNVGHWELGLLGQYDPTQVLLAGSVPPRFSMSTYAIGLRAGRREVFGPLDAMAGATASISLTGEIVNDPTNGNQAGGPPDTAEPRLGVYAGIAIPRRARVRLRPELAFDIVASHIGRSGNAPDSALPALPWWSTSASVGVEWEAP